MLPFTCMFYAKHNEKCSTWWQKPELLVYHYEQGIIILYQGFI